MVLHDHSSMAYTFDIYVVAVVEKEHAASDAQHYMHDKPYDAWQLLQHRLTCFRVSSQDRPGQLKNGKDSKSSNITQGLMQTQTVI